MIKVSCPSCGGEIEFWSKSSVLAVCSFCRSNIVRHDVNIDLLGKESALIEDMSPLQIGCTGIYKSRKFMVCGRLVNCWKDGRWSEWFIHFYDGATGWLAEAQGEFIMVTPANEKTPIPWIEDIKSGRSNSVDYLRRSYHLIDQKEIECIGSEGELPFKVTPGSKSFVADFSDGLNGFASIEYAKDDADYFYIGEFVSLRKMKMSGLRLFEGWSQA